MVDWSKVPVVGKLFGGGSNQTAQEGVQPVATETPQSPEGTVPTTVPVQQADPEPAQEVNVETPVGPASEVKTEVSSETANEPTAEVNTEPQTGVEGSTTSPFSSEKTKIS